jgi:hypothetical protein
MDKPNPLAFTCFALQSPSGRLPGQGLALGVHLELVSIAIGLHRIGGSVRMR